MRNAHFNCRSEVFLALPVDCGRAGFVPTQLRVPVLGCILVVVPKLGLGEQSAQLLGLLRAHVQVAAVQVLLNVHEEQVPEEQRESHTGE